MIANWLTIIPLNILPWYFQNHNRCFAIVKNLSCRGAEDDTAVSFPHSISPVS